MKVVRQAPRKKSDFYPRWRRLEFGNRIRMWDSQEELLGSGYGGTVTARSREAGGRCFYGLAAHDAATSPAYAGMSFNESAPDEALLLQGELMHATLRGYYLYCSTARLPMRKALTTSPEEHTGLQALGRLKHFCNPKSYDMLMELLDLYPEAVIEFGCYAHCLGEMPGHNTIVWEVREY